MTMSRLTENILKMKALKAEIDKLDDQKKFLQEQYDKLRLFDVPNEMAEQDLTSMRGEWGRCTLTGDLTVKVLDKQGLHVWLQAEGFGDLIVPTVNAQTLKSFAKEQLREGVVFPPEVAEVNPFSRAVLYAR